MTNSRRNGEQFPRLVAMNVGSKRRIRGGSFDSHRGFILPSHDKGEKKKTEPADCIIPSRLTRDSGRNRARTREIDLSRIWRRLELWKRARLISLLFIAALLMSRLI